MAKISTEERHKYFEKIRAYKSTIDTSIKKEQLVVQYIRKDPQDAAFKRLELAEEMLNLTSNYIIINGISQAVLKGKNEEALNEARKTMYRSVIYLEEIVSNYIDSPYSDYEERLAAIENVDETHRYLLARKMGLTLDLLKSGYGDNTKWKWTFVELEGRFAVVVKNMLNLRNAVQNTDPRSPDYEPTVYHLRLIKKLLSQSADRYREKYELSTSRLDDFKLGINFLSSLRRLHIAIGDREDAEIVKKKLEIWSAKLDSDLRKKEETAQRKA